jgi:hypothetical protein
MVFVVLSCIAVVCVVYRLYSVWPRMNSSSSLTKRDSASCFIVLGSGGHTSEIMPVAEALDPSKYFPRFVKTRRDWR